MLKKTVCQNRVRWNSTHKYFCFIFLLILLLSLCGCGKKQGIMHSGIDMGEEVSHYPVSILGADYMLYDNEYALIDKIKNPNFQMTETISYEGKDYTVIGVVSRTTLITDIVSDNSPENLVFIDSIKNLNFTVDSSKTANITLPDELETCHITFYWCPNITEIQVPDSCKLFGAEFYWCDGIEEFSCQDGMEALGTLKFSSCKNLKKVIYPATTNEHSVDWLSSCSFAECQSLEFVEIIEGMKDIQQGAFSDCPSLKTVIFPDTVTKMTDGIFSGCTAIQDITLSDGLSDVPAHMFYQYGKPVEPENLTIRVKADMVDFVKATYPYATVVAK